MLSSHQFVVGVEIVYGALSSNLDLENYAGLCYGKILPKTS